MPLNQKIPSLLLIFFTLFTVSSIDLGFTTDSAMARSRFGGRSFSRSRSYRPPTRQTAPSSIPRQNSTGSFRRGLAGGLMGGALGSMLFGGMAHGGGMGGFGGGGIGLFQILLFAGIAYFVYKRFFARPATSPYSRPTEYENSFYDNSMNTDRSTPPPPPPSHAPASVSEELRALQDSDPDFDPEHFTEIAQDVFFQVQAGWMRRDLSTYRHLLGTQLAAEYENHFAEMAQKGQINKLESIAIRKVEIVDAGVFGNFEAVTVLFTANLLDYTVDENSGEVIEGSTTVPVKFAEKWSWGRPVGTKEWKLERIEIA